MNFESFKKYTSSAYLLTVYCLLLAAN